MSEQDGVPAPQDPTVANLDRELPAHPPVRRDAFMWPMTEVEPRTAAWLAGYRKGLTEGRAEPPDGAVVQVAGGPADYPRAYVRMGTTQRHGREAGRWYQTGEDGSWMWWEDVCRLGVPVVLVAAAELEAARAEIDRLYAGIERLGENAAGCRCDWRGLLV